MNTRVKRFLEGSLYAVGLIAAIAVVFTAGWATGRAGIEPQPDCPVEDSCVANYYDGEWHITEADDDVRQAPVSPVDVCREAIAAADTVASVLEAKAPNPAGAFDRAFNKLLQTQYRDRAEECLLALNN